MCEDRLSGLLAAKPYQGCGVDHRTE
jgi:hypothetical protein